MQDPKKRFPQHDLLRRLHRDDLRRHMLDAASSLMEDAADTDPEEDLAVPCWIEPRQLIRILAPYVCLN